MEEEERTFTPGQAEAMDALLSGRNVFLSGNAGTGKSYVLNAFIEELEEREVPYLAMAPTGIAAQNLHNGTTIHRTLQVGFGVLDPRDEAKAEDPRIWRYTFDGEKMHVQDGRFVFD